MKHLFTMKSRIFRLTVSHIRMLKIYNCCQPIQKIVNLVEVGDEKLNKAAENKNTYRKKDVIQRRSVKERNNHQKTAMKIIKYT